MLYFFLIGLNFLLLQALFLHVIFPASTFKFGALIFVLHSLQINMLYSNLASASGNLAKINTSSVILAKLENQ